MNKRCFLHFIFLLLMIKVSVPLIVQGFNGDTVILPCLTKEKTDTVFWRFGESRTVCIISKGEADFKEQDSAFKNRVGIFASEILLGNFSIKLNSVSKTDEGMYTCSAPTKVSQEVELKVKAKPGNGQNKPQVDGVMMFLLGCVLLYSFSF